jgi:pyruvate,water dikinase
LRLFFNCPFSQKYLKEQVLESYVIKLDQLGMQDIETVGGKNASLGEMISNLHSLGVTVPGGFATTSAAYREFLKNDGLDERIRATLDDLEVGGQNHSKMGSGNPAA